MKFESYDYLIKCIIINILTIIHIITLNSQLSILNSQLNKLQFIPVPIRIIFLRIIFYNLLPIHLIKIFSYICRNSPR
mgnify:CR=1 FL=1